MFLFKPIGSNLLFQTTGLKTREGTIKKKQNSSFENIIQA